MSRLEAVVAAVRASGFDCSIEQVRDVVKWGSVAQSAIGEDYDQALTDHIQEELDSQEDAK